MFSFLGVSVGYAFIGLYLYVVAAILRAEFALDNTAMAAVTKAALWPVTIWNTIDKLYLSDPAG